MRAYRIDATLSEDGSLTLDDLPFRKGERVEIIVLEREQQESREPNPLAGSVHRYDDPAEPVAPGEWEVLR